MRPITVVLLTLLALPASAQDARVFHDAAGRITGSARTDANGVTTFHDAMGRTTGTARTNSNGVTTFPFSPWGNLPLGEICIFRSGAS